MVMPNDLDNMYYKRLKNNRDLLTSDQSLVNSGLTRKMVVLKVRLGSTASC